MKTITLNIGLNTNDGSPAIKLHWAFTLLNNRFEVIDSRVDISPNGGETTIVAVVQKLPDLVDKLHDYCLFAKQDCIAVREWQPSELVRGIWTKADWSDGELIGPNAAKWGQFDPAYFVPFELPPQGKEIVHHGFTRRELIAYLPSIIQDSREAGFMGYAKDLEVCLAFLND